MAQKDGRFSFEFTEFPWGCEYYLKTGKMMPEDGIETLSHFDAIYLGAVGYPGVPDHISLRDLLLRIRHDFDQYVNLRPVKLLKGAPCPLVGITEKDIDMVFIRENSEGEYAGSGAWRLSGHAAGKQSIARTGSSPALGQSASCAMPMNWLKRNTAAHQHQ
mgnify:CR=1 FL=1